jgi:hypothetical protein
MKQRIRTAEEGGRPQSHGDARGSAWRAPSGLSRAQLEAAARVIRAHADRIAAHWREDARAELSIGRPIEH